MNGYVYTKVYGGDGKLKLELEGHNDVHGDLLTNMHRMLTNPADFDFNNSGATYHLKPLKVGMTGASIFLCDDLAVGSGTDTAITPTKGVVLAGFDYVLSDTANSMTAVMGGETSVAFGKYNNNTDTVDASSTCITQRHVIRDVHGPNGTGAKIMDAIWANIDSFVADGNSGKGTTIFDSKFATYAFNGGAGISLGVNDTLVLDWNLETTAS